MSDLKDDLMDIQGVGEATADSILEVLDEHDTGGDESKALERAIEYAQRGDSRNATVWLKRYAEE